MSASSIDAFFYAGSMLGVVVLGVALAYAVIRNRRRNRANDRIGQEATREMYEHPETYDRKSEELKQQLR